MNYTKEQLELAKFHIESTIHKLVETKKTLLSKPNQQRYVSQVTLATRRIDAFMIALNLIEEKVTKV